MSLLFLYQRIFGVVRPFRIALLAAGFCVIGYWIACTILAFTACHPLARNWDKTVPGTCVDLIAFFRWNGICNLIIDFMILMLPMPMVWRLKITLKQKVVLSGMFALGLLYVRSAFHLTIIFVLIYTASASPRSCESWPTTRIRSRTAHTRQSAQSHGHQSSRVWG